MIQFKPGMMVRVYNKWHKEYMYGVLTQVRQKMGIGYIQFLPLHHQSDQWIDLPSLTIVE